MPKEFNCPSCTEPMVFQGGESIFQTCKNCNAPVIVPSDMLYGKEQKLASEEFASLNNDIAVDVDQVTNELTPGSSLPKDEDILDPDAKIEKFEVYQEKIGTHAIETKKAVDQIVAPHKEMDFKTASPFANIDGSLKSADAQKKVVKMPINPALIRVQNQLQSGNKIEAIKIFREKFDTSLRDAKDYVEALERGEDIDISQFLNQQG